MLRRAWTVFKISKSAATSDKGSRDPAIDALDGESKSTHIELLASLALEMMDASSPYPTSV